MAVYTALTEQEIGDLLAGYALGGLVRAKGIATGVENSNYLLETERGKFILTLFEKRMKAEELPFFIDLMGHLAHARFPAPEPIPDREGRILQQVKGKPAVIVSFLTGESPLAIRDEHMAPLGATIARMHLTGRDFKGHRPNDLSLRDWQALYTKIEPRLNEIHPRLLDEMDEEMDYLNHHWPEPGRLPGGVIHADLFPDNVFFDNGSVSGVIDFYFACTDSWLYDLAIVLNAWCFEPGGEFHLTRAQRLLEAYDAIRRIGAEERELMPILARGAAMRFFLTRAHDWLNQVEGALVTPKDPMDYVRRLRHHRHVENAFGYGLM